MAEAWPAELCPAQMSWGCRYNSRAFTSTLSNAQQVVSYPGTYWTCSMQFDALTRKTERRISSLIGRLRGMAGTVNVPAFTRKRSDDIGNPVVSIANTNVLQINARGITKSGIVFREGDYITILGQLYEVTADVTAASGTAVIPVNKRVRSNIPAGTPIEYRNPYCEMRLTSDTFSLNIQPVISSGSIELREAF